MILCTQSTCADTLTLRDKIGQMLLIGFEGKSIDQNAFIVKAIEEEHIGGVILFDVHHRHKTCDKNIESPEQVQKLTQDLQYVNRKANEQHRRPQTPLLIAVDYEGGLVSRLKETYGFPATLSAEDIGQMSLMEADQHAYAMAMTLKTAGFNLNLAPVLDLNLNPSNPIIGALQRSFSANPVDVIKYADIYSSNFLAQSVQCAYKHFPGHGSSTSDSHLGFVDSSDVWQSQELEPYQKLLSKQSCGVIMTAHIVNRNLDDSGLPATLSHHVLTHILRERLHFSGVIMSDDMQMKAIADHFGLKHALILAINAGVDLFIFGNQLPVVAQNPKELIDIIESAVQLGHIKSSRIDEAYQHILNLKKSL
ncbi:MAG: glycosyl hydrolase [Legionella sp.]|nr:MAG: glycosyl hydrolase [Legionella sp.]